ncbi:MAG: hypothetical protein JNG84_02190 [Archangium sp.]|nr:hypothetical protein [Archangium sp.]
MRPPFHFIAAVAFASCSGTITGVTGEPGDAVVCDEACQQQARPDGCLSTREYFAQWSWPHTFSTCVACHVAGGQADGTHFILKSPSLPGFVDANLAAVTEAANLRQGDEPLLHLKPTGQVPHQGGTVIFHGSQAHAVLLETLKQVAEPVTCPGDAPMLPAPSPVTEGVTLMSPAETLRKATLVLGRRLPTAEELAAAQAEGMPAVEATALRVMDEATFHDVLRDVFADVLLTDAFLWRNRDTHGGGLVADDTFDPPANNFGNLADWEWQSSADGIRTTDALAREPVEFIVHAVKTNRPLTEILTGRYRLMNAASARFFGATYAGDANDPNDFREVLVPVVNERRGPGEYAGILTTTAFLSRYPNTPTNFNRKRARFILKYFGDLDIMKTAPRIDASAIDLAANPTRNNAACTGCHAKIDPLAGAMANWTECGYSDHPHYFSPTEKGNGCSDRGWLPDARVFPPGTGEGTSAPLTDTQRATGAEHLAAALAARDGFAQAMVAHVAAGILARPLLSAPQDPMHPAYAHLDAAYEYERTELRRFATAFRDGGLLLKPLVLAIVTSPLFRATSADRADRVELTGLGGGTLLTPEELDRRLEVLLGVPWMEPAPGTFHDGVGPRYLQRAAMFKVAYGGTDQTTTGAKVRQRQPSSITARVVERMALMTACIATSRDFDTPVAQRRLFPNVEKTLVPSGNPDAVDQQPILQNIAHLHERLLGETLALDDAEVRATYALLTSARTDGLAAISGGMATARLSRPCANDVDVRTGTLRSPAGTVNDAAFVVRAWQAVITSLLMDSRFITHR